MKNTNSKTTSNKEIAMDCLRSRAAESVKKMAQLAFEKSYDESPGYWRLVVDNKGSVTWQHGSSLGEYGEGEQVLKRGVGYNGCGNGADEKDYLNEDGSFIAFSDIFPNQDEAEYMQDALGKLQNIPEGWFIDESSLLVT